VKTKRHNFKRLGEQFIEYTFERQAVVFHVQVALHNRLTPLGPSANGGL
jgi:hypothetical protein